MIHLFKRDRQRGHIRVILRRMFHYLFDEHLVPRNSEEMGVLITWVWIHAEGCVTTCTTVTFKRVSLRVCEPLDRHYEK